MRNTPWIYNQEANKHMDREAQHRYVHKGPVRTRVSDKHSRACLLTNEHTQGIDGFGFVKTNCSSLGICSQINSSPGSLFLYLTLGFVSFELALCVSFSFSYIAGRKTTYIIQKQYRMITLLSTSPIRGTDRKSTRLNSSHSGESRMPSSA